MLNGWSSGLQVQTRASRNKNMPLENIGHVIFLDKNIPVRRKNSPTTPLLVFNRYKRTIKFEQKLNNREKYPILASAIMNRSRTSVPAFAHRRFSA